MAGLSSHSVQPSTSCTLDSRENKITNLARFKWSAVLRRLEMSFNGSMLNINVVTNKVTSTIHLVVSISIVLALQRKFILFWKNQVNISGTLGLQTSLISDYNLFTLCKCFMNCNTYLFFSKLNNLTQKTIICKLQLTEQIFISLQHQNRS
jgi:hypothetical protein